MRVPERGQPGDVLVVHGLAAAAQVLDDGVEVARVPQHDGVEDQAERGELVLSEMILKALGGLRSALALTHCDWQESWSVPAPGVSSRWLSGIRAGSPGVGPEVGHAEVDGGVLGGQLPHGGELLPGCGDAGLDRGHLAEPALLLSLAETVEEVGVDLLQARQLGSGREIGCRSNVRAWRGSWIKAS